AGERRRAPRPAELMALSAVKMDDGTELAAEPLGFDFDCELLGRLAVEGGFCAGAARESAVDRYGEGGRRSRKRLLGEMVHADQDGERDAAVGYKTEVVEPGGDFVTERHVERRAFVGRVGLQDLLRREREQQPRRLAEPVAVEDERARSADP